MFNPLAFLAVDEARFPVCLYSATSTNHTEARYSYVPDQPQLVLSQQSDGSVCLNGRPTPDDFDTCLDRLISDRANKDKSPLFTSGWLVYYGFESYLNWRGLSGQAAPAPSEQNLPSACLWRVDRVLAHDRHSDRLSYFCSGQSQPIPTDIQSISTQSAGERSLPRLTECVEQKPAIFLDGCRRLIEAIRQGQVIQVNLSRRWQLSFDRVVDSHRLAMTLARINPAPFFCSFPLGDQRIVSASPERLFRIRNDQIETRPLGGTIERSRDDVMQDLQWRRRLRQDEKLKSEHIMLVDLERSDLARICQLQSVRAAGLMQVETHPWLHHLLSVITGQLNKDVTPSAIFQAMCPGGSISGCPKKMCLSLLREIETGRREWYTGAFGYIDDSGNADINLLIRSLAVHDNQAYFFTGAGIVVDSDPEEELQETRLKARGLLRALSDFSQ